MKSVRFGGIDIWRAILPLLGVVYHSLNKLSEQDGFGWVSAFAIATHAFRMEAFFALAGALAGMRLDRPGYLLRRWQILLVPVAVLWTWSLLRHPEHGGALLAGRNGHLWFLLTLTLLTTVAVVSERSGVIRRAVAHWHITLPACVLWAVAARLGGFTLWAYPTPMLAAARYGIYYAPFVLSGIVAVRSEAARAMLYRCRKAWMIGCVGSIVLILIWLFDPAAPKADAQVGVMRSLLIVATAICWTTGLLGGGLDPAAPPAGRPVRWLAEAGFTIYLLHFPVIGAFYHRTHGLDERARVVACIVVAVAVPLAFHALADRVPLLRFLLNGVLPARWQRPLPRAAPVSPQPARRRR